MTFCTPLTPENPSEQKLASTFGRYAGVATTRVKRALSASVGRPGPTTYEAEKHLERVTTNRVTDIPGSLGGNVTDKRARMCAAPLAQGPLVALSYTCSTLAGYLNK